MATNEEIIYSKLDILQKKFLSESLKANSTTRLEININNLRKMLNEARVDTAEQIFKELESYIYISKETKTGKNTDVRKGNVALDLNRGEYQALKKKYKAD